MSYDPMEPDPEEQFYEQNWLYLGLVVLIWALAMYAEAMP